ncbi:O-antigen ligase family protein [Methylotenera sp. N17]|uniref:O-antigen ligase family protein n=1 Tax=Methylotenera sp. N17 TaxID=1502761 RepID=UPI000646EA06|nr:O-antigen ligase family protein [Methylotenera sp. N17]
MPEFIKAYIVILVLSTFAFHFAKKATAGILPSTQFNYLKNSWLVVTSFAFLTFNFWLFLAASCVFVAVRVKKTAQPLALYMALLTAVPPITAAIPGFGVMNYLMQVDYLVMLSAGLLLIVYFKLKSPQPSFGRINTDVFLLCYLLVNIGLNLIGTTMTDNIRQCAVIFLTTFLPYYIISRRVQDVDHLKAVFAGFMVACFPAAMIGLFEAGKSWLLYTSIQHALNQYWQYGGYLMRDGGLRASSSFGHSIAFGFTMVIALGFYLFVQSTIKNKFFKLAGFGIITLGLIAPLSRGPWVGAMVLVTIYLYLGRNGLSNLLKLAMGGILTLALVLMLPIGGKVMNLLPFVGKTDSQNVDYRQQLLDTSLIVVAKSPWFGNRNFKEAPEMKKMVQGEHIIDLVNIYVSVMLNSGYVGLFFYLGMFLTAIWAAYRAMKRIRTVHNELFQIGRSLISSILAVMFMIAAMSDTLIIPYLYYMLIALCVAYSQIVKKVLLLESLPTQPVPT